MGAPGGQTTGAVSDGRFFAPVVCPSGAKGKMCKWLEFCEQFKFLEIKQLTLPPFFVTMFTQLELMHEMYSLKCTY